jgi:hypothetical protein
MWTLTMTFPVDDMDADTLACGRHGEWLTVSHGEFRNGINSHACWPVVRAVHVFP